MKKKLLILIVLIAIGLSSVIPLLQPGYFKSDDGEWMVIRFSAFHQELREGQFPVRFLGRLNQEYGYPVANFLYPGFMYLAEAPKALGFGFINSVKIIFGLSLIASLFFSYIWLRKFFDQISSLIGSVVYLYFPYHMYDVYKRGSIGEVLALAIVPFILWQIERKNLFWSSIGIALLILSHNTLALLFFPVIISYMILDVFLTHGNRKLIYQYASMLACGLGISTFFWIPALFDLQYTIFSKTVVSQWQQYFSDVSLIGFSTISIFIFVSILFISKRIAVRKHRLTVFFFVIGLVSIFFATSASATLWNVLPVSFIQFPFRFLSVTIIASSFLAACAFSVLSNKERVLCGTVFMILIVISVTPFLNPTSFEMKTDAEYATNVATTTVANEYMPLWVKDIPQAIPLEKVTLLSGDSQITNIQSTSKKVSFDAEVAKASIFAINIIYFPGWEVFLNGEKTVFSYENSRGIMHITVPAGNHNVQAIFGETPLRLFANTVSFLFIIGVSGFGIYTFVKRSRKKI